MFPPFPTDSVSEMPTALLTRYTLPFHAASPHTQRVLILCLSSGYMRKHLRRLPPGAVPSLTYDRVLYHLDALDRRMAVWKSAMLQDTQVIGNNVLVPEYSFVYGDIICDESHLKCSRRSGRI